MSGTEAHIQIDLPMEAIAAFCERWQIAEFALFGSVLRDDFTPESDIDVLVRFSPEGKVTLRRIMAMEEEIRQIFGRNVDFIVREDIERSANYLRRRAILGTAKTIYGA